MRIEFIPGRPKVRLTKHCVDRLRNRVKLKNDRQKQNFIKKASQEALPIFDIPKEEYHDFFSYMYGKMKRVKKKNSFNFLVLFRDYFIVTSYSGEFITLYEIGEEFKGIYYRIKEFIQSKLLAETC